MKTDPSIEALTQQYLAGELSETDYKALVERISSHPEEAEQVVEEVVKAYGRLQLKARLDEFHSAGSAAPFQRRRLYTGIAAVLLLLILPLGYFWLSSRPSDAQLFDTYFEPYRNLNAVRAGADSQEVKWKEAILLYEANKYATAAPLFLGLSEEEIPTRMLARLYSGVCYLAQDPPQTELAIPYLKAVAEADHDLQDQGRWYLVMAYLERGDIELAKQALDLFKGSPGTYKFKEVEILKQQLK